MDEPVADQPEVSPRRSRRSLSVLAVAGAVALLVLLAWATLSAGKGRNLVARIAAGETPPAPAFTLEAVWPENARWPEELAHALEGGELSLEELRGRPAVLNFWASWCIPCREEAPILNGSQREHRGEVVFVGINVQDLRGDARAFLREFDVPYVSVRDRNDETFDAYGLTGVPETYYLDAAGRIVAHTPGAISRETLEAGIAAAIASRAQGGG